MFGLEKIIFGQLLVLFVHGRYPWLEQVTRQEQLTAGCDRLQVRKSLNWGQLDHILVDHKHRLLYCYVPKVACTNWKRILMVLTGVTSATNLIDIPGSVAHNENSTLKLSQLQNDTISNCVNTYTTFIMVRHPFERLLSAYRNKFETTYTQYFRIRYGKDIIRKYRKNATKTDLETGRNVSFREFVLYILNGGATANEHWAPIYDLCQPCSLNYTFIGRYESLVEDARTLLDMIGAPSLTFPYTKPSHTSYKLKKYFQQLSMNDIQRLYKQYEYDFKLFGYNLEHLLGFDLP
ncbi:carbohydrate sulfotransferase 11-like isoform X1 [Tribolium madens]|uniref:carbohydrate sulfotransferase 11-like isoform X1 n=1 Tax=Tribolium madens TaxID=41895 RepID=UPI001CF749D3|nr:carbohydrate sulfotransferase 11-like isoform X1 [Tribolium madens]